MLKDFLASGAVGRIEYDAQRKIRQDIQERWERLGFVDGLQGHVKENIATLYENEAKHLIYEATSSDNSGSFETVVFPIIRRIFSKLLANDIVSVQAMNLPIGKLFFILPVTSQREWNYQVEGQINDGDTGRHVGLMGYDRVDRNKDGAVTPRYYLPDEVVQGIEDKWVDMDNTANEYDSVADGVAAGVPATRLRKKGPAVTSYMKKTLYDLFYNDFLFDNSKGKVTIKVGGAVPVLLRPDGDFEIADMTAYPTNSLDGSIRNVILKVTGFSSFNAGRLTGPDGNEMDSEAFLASLKVISENAIEDADDSGYTTFRQYESIPFRIVTQRYGHGIVDYGTICDAKGELYLELDLIKPIKEQGKTMDGYIGVNPNAFSGISGDTEEEITEQVKNMFKIAWAEYDSLELETEIGEVSFKLSSVTVTVEERKLRATWSPELAQDVSAFHNIDAEAELTAMLSEQIASEVDREILRDLRKAAPWVERWDYNGWKRQAAFSTNYTQKDWNQTLMTAINRISAQIQKSTLRGGANYVVVSTEIGAVLNDLEYFHVTDASAESNEYNMGIERIGSLNGRYKVIVDPYAPWWSLIMGHQGKSLLDTGYIYAPYVPMALTPVMYNPMNAAPIKFIATRYAKKIVNNRFFGAIRVDGVPHFNQFELR